MILVQAQSQSRVTEVIALRQPVLVRPFDDTGRTTARARNEEGPRILLHQLWIAEREDNVSINYNLSTNNPQHTFWFSWNFLLDGLTGGDMVSLMVLAQLVSTLRLCSGMRIVSP